MIRDFLRHWVFVDLRQFRRWVTDEQIASAHLIDNKDGTFGRAFDLRALPPEMLVAKSETMELALRSGVGAIEPLPSGPPRRIVLPPRLQDLVQQYGRYDLIPPEAWSRWDQENERWRRNHIADRNVIPNDGEA